MISRQLILGRQIQKGTSYDFVHYGSLSISITSIFILRIVPSHIIALLHVNLENFSKLGHKWVGRCERVGRSSANFSFKNIDFNLGICCQIMMKCLDFSETLTCQSDATPLTELGSNGMPGGKKGNEHISS